MAKFIGVTRLSPLTIEARERRSDRRENREQSASKLFNEACLADRFKVFENIAAPIMQSMATKHEYSHLVQYSSQLPIKWQNRLFEIAAGYPVIKPVEDFSKGLVESVVEEVRTWPKDFRGVFAWFSVGSDDVLAQDYLDVLTKYTIHENVGTAICFNQVVSAMFDGWTYSDARSVYIPLESQRAAFICRANVNLDSIEVPEILPNHHVHERVPTTLLPEDPHILWTRHALEDAPDVDVNPKIGRRIANLQADLGRSPHYPENSIIEKFPSLRSYLHPSKEATITSVTLSPGTWKDISLTPAAEGQFYRIDIALDVDGAPDSHTTLAFKYSDENEAQGHFPHTIERGNYRRIYSNAYGHATIYIPALRSTKPVQLRILTDPQGARINRANVSISLEPRK